MEENQNQENNNIEESSFVLPPVRETRMPHNSRPPTPLELQTFGFDNSIQIVTNENKEQKSLEDFGFRVGLSPQDKTKAYFEYFDYYIEDICEMMVNCVNFKEICKHLNVPLSPFFRWRLSGKHSAKIEDAMRMSSEIAAIRAEEVLHEGLDPKDMANAGRIRELSQYYRWLASKRQPKVFGQHVEKEINVNVESKIDSQQEFDQLIEMIKKQSEAPAQNQLGTDRNSHITDAEIIGGV